MRQVYPSQRQLPDPHYPLDRARLTTEGQKAMTNNKDSTEKRLRLLKEQASSNYAAVVAQRATSTFSLDKEPMPEASQRDVRVVVYPQDPFVGDPEVRNMHAEDIHPGL